MSNYSNFDEFQTPPQINKSIFDGQDFQIPGFGNGHPKSNAKNPFTSFINSSSEKNLFAFSSSHKKDKKEEEPVSENDSLDTIIQKWEDKIDKKKRIAKKKKKQSHQTDLVFTRKKRQSQRNIGKLLVMNLNRKNSKNLIFDPTERTLISIPCCQNCHEVFENFAGVGGHKRVCKIKKEKTKLVKQFKISDLDIFEPL